MLSRMTADRRENWQSRAYGRKCRKPGVTLLLSYLNAEGILPITCERTVRMTSFNGSSRVSQGYGDGPYILI